MGRTTSLRRVIKRDFVPHLRDKGFSLDMRHAPQFFTFRKIDTDAVYVCDIQWEKYGRPRFVLNFGKCSADSVSFRGERLLPGDIFPVHTPERGRLAPGRQWTTGGWFRQDRPLVKRFVHFSKLYPAEEVVSQLIALFGEVEEFWKSGFIGPHIRLLPALPPFAGDDATSRSLTRT
jgi:hypothetical protein